MTLDRTPLHMTKDVTTLPDGRYLIYYTFDQQSPSTYSDQAEPANVLASDPDVSGDEEAARHV